MKNTISIIIICVFLFLYCSKDKSINSTSCSSDAEFIIDSFDINAEQERYPQTDSLWCQINTIILYHFEKDMGSLLSAIFQVENYYWSKRFFSISTLKDPYIIYTYEDSRWIKDLSDQDDSLNINYYFEGVIGDNPKCVRVFNDSLKVTIPINRIEH